MRVGERVIEFEGLSRCDFGFAIAFARRNRHIVRERGVDFGQPGVRKSKVRIDADSLPKIVDRLRYSFCTALSQK